MKTILNLISENLEKFNEANNSDLHLILKGSYLFYEKQMTKRIPNDLDFSFYGEHSFNLRNKFINSLKENNELEIIKEDENLKIYKLNGISIEFILLESLDSSTTVKREQKYIDQINLSLAFNQKIMMISYVLDDVYPHNANVKMTNIINDLNEIWPSLIKNNQYEIISDKVLYNLFWNSFYIYWYYDYDRMLNLNFDLNKIKKFSNLIKYPEIYKSIYKLFDYINNHPKIQKLMKFMDRLLKNKEKILSDFKNYLNFPTLPGFEKNFINRYFKNKITYENNAASFVLKNSQNNIVFVSHCDEVGGLVINKNVYNQGTMYWEDGDYILYDENSSEIKSVRCFKTDNYIFSEEKDRKINRPHLICNNLDNNIYQILPKQEVSVSCFKIKSRNQDNKISNILLNNLLDYGDINVILTTKEELLLQGSKDTSVLNELNKYKYIINLDVNQSDQWDIEGIQIRVADNFTAPNVKLINKISQICLNNNIPYSLYFGSGSTDLTNFQNLNAITLSISASLIHCIKSETLLKNFFYLLWICLELNDELS
ncbi:hypothetical protein [Mycoplasmopsis felis]|uniref:hypothetical protein n=1 Tax=Mycoplasmopsis felis TaxID=33923 RepID=UPI002AFF8156|nr:hypothetical protein [Mycoplasmopsis felis]WQQ07756.1 hypothetical protein RRG57_00080 [Mycoplasmopsis felis]